jgi:hypothetical protein
MASKATSLEGRFIRVGGSFHGLPVYFGVFLAPRWMMLEKVLEVSTMRSWSYLVAKPSQVGVDVDRTSCLVRCLTAGGHQPGA